MRNYIPIEKAATNALWRFVGLPAERGLDLTRFLQNGLPLNVIDNLHEWSEMSKSDILRIAGINERNIARRRSAGCTLNANESERIARFIRVFDAAVCLFDGDKQAAYEWLNNPVKGLGYVAPVSLIATESGAIDVLDLIGRLEHGIFS
ncbi:toxin-antitoxin system antitoxin component [Photorhabdus temperata]|uniref:Putative toxin-antitoxin system antitoxin component, TIGR02293 family n=1 Tax=Photorhabdus khanii NC19 TaxID=1004151 RepID=W3V0C1_9GAMM|nr:antitoxin Xre/MbcA/ParS toxin-binding domain-containing protein [Photorhabdus khanii]ETS29272.1 putative toxin-antitoxin system antitoxin component, TIGR02293 family [Photorhabdus khanii NC19]OHV49445.1 toxin-antitoxin system antitoxin component [Photorhabdus temperata]